MTKYTDIASIRTHMHLLFFFFFLSGSEKERKKLQIPHASFHNYHQTLRLRFANFPRGFEGSIKVKEDALKLTLHLKWCFMQKLPCGQPDSVTNESQVMREEDG